MHVGIILGVHIGMHIGMCIGVYITMHFRPECELETARFRADRAMQCPRKYRAKPPGSGANLPLGYC